jgi:hypothetical protein
VSIGTRQRAQTMAFVEQQEVAVSVQRADHHPCAIMEAISFRLSRSHDIEQRSCL